MEIQNRGVAFIYIKDRRKSNCIIQLFSPSHQPRWTYGWIMQDHKSQKSLVFTEEEQKVISVTLPSYYHYTVHAGLVLYFYVASSFPSCFPSSFSFLPFSTIFSCLHSCHLCHLLLTTSTMVTTFNALIKYFIMDVSYDQRMPESSSFQTFTET